MWTDKFSRLSEKMWNERLKNLPEAFKELDEKISLCSDVEAAALRFMLSSLPASDLAEYDFSLFLHTAQAALNARENYSWCKELSEDDFAVWVLCPRINDEELCDCRPFFHDELKDRISGLCAYDAVIEVNRWCRENARYSLTDTRTASAMHVFNCGFGRCGEESMFAINALRSVGIAARQVYAPWWSHCDDNHAWVEALTGESWHYFGACEPEPRLDSGWFNTASSQAMLEHVKAFLNESFYLDEFTDGSCRDFFENGVLYRTVTENYAEVKNLCVTLLDRHNKPVSGARLSFSVLNMAELKEISARITDSNGRAYIELGRGTVHVSAFFGGAFAEAIVDVFENDNITLMPGKGMHEKEDIYFHCPSAALRKTAELSETEKRESTAFYAMADKKLAQKRLNAPPLTPFESRVWNTLSEKDRAEAAKLEVLESRRELLQFESDYPEDVFESCVLSPRSGREPLKAFKQPFTEAETVTFRKEPKLLWERVLLKKANEACMPSVCASPSASLKLGWGNAESRDVLFVALCRSIGVAARLNFEDGLPEYYSAGGFISVAGTRTACLSICADGEIDGISRQNFSLSEITDKGFLPLCIAEIKAGESRSPRLKAGKYRLITTKRLNNGSQLARINNFTLDDGETKRISLTWCEEALDEGGKEKIADFSLSSFTGDKKISAAALCKEAESCTVFVWLQLNAEPTEHILNELCGCGDLADFGARLNFIISGDERPEDSPAFLRALKSQKGAKVWRGNFTDSLTGLCGRLHLDLNRLPLVLLCNKAGECVYGLAGYNAGSVGIIKAQIASV